MKSAIEDSFAVIQDKDQQIQQLQRSKQKLIKDNKQWKNEIDQKNTEINEGKLK